LLSGAVSCFLLLAPESRDLHDRSMMSFACLEYKHTTPNPSRYTHIRPAFGEEGFVTYKHGLFETLPDRSQSWRETCRPMLPSRRHTHRIEIYAADASFHRTHINLVPGVRQITPRKLLIKPPAQMGCRLLRVQRPREQTTCNQTRKAHAE